LSAWGRACVRARRKAVGGSTTLHLERFLTIASCRERRASRRAAWIPGDASIGSSTLEASPGGNSESRMRARVSKEAEVGGAFAWMKKNRQCGSLVWEVRACVLWT